MIELVSNVYHGDFISTPPRLHEGGIPCPEVVLLRKHVLIMSFIGQDQRPAPKIKEAKLTQDEMASAYQQTIEVCIVIVLSHLSTCIIHEFCNNLGSSGCYFI